MVSINGTYYDIYIMVMVSSMLVCHFSCCGHLRFGQLDGGSRSSLASWRPQGWVEHSGGQTLRNLVGKNQTRPSWDMVTMYHNLYIYIYIMYITYIYIHIKWRWRWRWRRWSWSWSWWSLCVCQYYDIDRFFWPTRRDQCLGVSLTDRRAALGHGSPLART